MNAIYKSIYVPANLDQAKEIATLLDERNPRDLLKCHAAHGHHFGGDMGKVQTQSYCLKGKPSLSADAMAGICRNSGLVRYWQIVEWNAQLCRIIFARKDEPKEIKHEYVYTMEMAGAQGLTRNRNWQTMPLQMLRSRCMTMGLRATYPDAVSGIYSADEIADNTNMSDDERARISAESLGEDLNLKEAPQRQQRPSKAPVKQAPVKQAPPKPKSEPLYTFSSEEMFWEIVDEHNISEEEVQGVIDRKRLDLSDMTPRELEDFFYSSIIHRVIRQSWGYVDEWWLTDIQESIEAQHNAFVAEYPILEECPPAIYGPRLNDPAYVEVLRHSNFINNHVKDVSLNTLAEVRKALRYMKKNDWSRYHGLISLTANADS